MASTAASAAAAAAAKCSGRYAIHPLLPGAAQLAVEVCTGRLRPSWTPTAQRLMGTLEQVGPCLPRYQEFLKKTNRKDLKRIHVFMNEQAQAKLAEFYLCCALRMRPEEVDAAGQDAQKLMALANDVATKDVEPFFEECRKFVADYDWELHQSLDNTTVWREVEDGLFWHHSFEVAAPSQYRALREELLPPEASWPDREDLPAIQALLERCSPALDGGDARVLAEDVYQRFLEASASPVKAAIRAALIDHGIIAGEVVYRGLQDGPSAKAE